MKWRALFLAAAAAMLTGACSTSTDAPDDPRLGEQGKVRFTSGCNGSTTMALGSKAIVLVEPVEGALPDALGVKSDNPGAITAAMGEEPAEVALHAVAMGQARIALDTSGSFFDAITFDVDAATATEWVSVPRAFVGGTVEVVVTDVYGGCGTDACRLFGHEFMDWRAEPTSALTFLGEERGTARFVAHEATGVDITATERSASADLVSATVELVVPDGVTGLRATLTTIPLEEGEEARSLVLGDASAEVRLGEAFCIRVAALPGADPEVPVSRHDVSWDIDGTALESLDLAHGSEPLGTVFNTLGEGTVTVSVRSHLFDAADSWQIRVVGE